MAQKIGFAVDSFENERAKNYERKPKEKTIIPRKSIVKVYFEKRDASYSYFNDKFDLEVGDYVWVEGKLEGILGRVVDINYNFKIKLSDYKKVIGVTLAEDVDGKYKLVGPYFFTDRALSLFSNVKTWFIPPQIEEDEEEIIVGYDDFSFNISELGDLPISQEEAEKGSKYYREDDVAFIGISGGHGTAIIDGHKPHLVEFEYENGVISNLICDCFEAGVCRHQFGVLLTLRAIIGFVGINYPKININDDGFSAVRKCDYFKFMINQKNTGEITFK